MADPGYRLGTLHCTEPVRVVYDRIHNNKRDLISESKCNAENNPQHLIQLRAHCTVQYRRVYCDGMVTLGGRGPTARVGGPGPY